MHTSVCVYIIIKELEVINLTENKLRNKQRIGWERKE